MSSQILVLNCGSSSIKFALINPDVKEAILTGLAEKLGLQDACVTFKQNGEKQKIDITPPDHSGAMNAIITELGKRKLLEQVIAVGHRVVHGGEVFTQSIQITDEVIKQIETCSKLAPLHNPANLLGIHAAIKCFPTLPQVAVFDTSFHQTMPEKAFLYALPMTLYREHSVRRYGFHGTSYRFVCAEAARVVNKSLEQTAQIIAHLGNGASISAVLGGKSIDTSMGLTPLEGLVMGTRSGDIDPGLLPYLSSNLNMSVSDIDNMLNKKSGLLGLSEVSNDCREIEEAAAAGNTGALMALEVFCYRLAKYIGAYAVALGRLDMLVFTGGIGENSSLIRGKVLSQLGVLGISLDNAANEKCTRGAEGHIDAGTGPAVLVIATNEELMIALDTVAQMK